MKKLLVGIIILMLLMWTPPTNKTSVKTVIKDTVKVYAVTTNIFHVVVPSLIDGQGYGKNIPDLQKTDTTYFIKHPKNRSYTSISRDSLRLKLNELLL